MLRICWIVVKILAIGLQPLAKDRIHLSERQRSCLVKQLWGYNGLRYRGIAVLPGKHGGRIIKVKDRIADLPELVRHKSESLESVFSLPHHFSNKSVGEFFGFKQLDDDTWLIPDYEEFFGALTKVNTSLRAQGKSEIPLQYYRVRSNHKVTPLEYLQQIADGPAVPFGETNHYFFHDLAGHSAAIAVPVDFWRHAQSQVRTLLEFEDWLKVENPKLFHSEVFQKHLEKVHMYASQQIDFGNANFGIHRRGPRQKPFETWKSYLAQLVLSGNSPHGYIEWLLDQMLNQDLKEVVPLFEKFTTQQGAEFFRRLRRTDKQILDEVNEREREITEAVERLQPKSK